MNGLEYLDRITTALSRLPGIGRRSAERMAYRLAGDPEGVLRELSQALQDARENIRLCNLCGSITTVTEMPCRLCTHPSRDGLIVCVVQDPSDIVALERTGTYKGRYHALMGVVSPMHGEGPGDIRLQALLKRLDTEGFQEVIMALGMDAESEATASYIAEVLKPRKLRITRLATGIPVGSGIGYSDNLTLARAMKGRQNL
ncbi:MAG: recombination mediator RecR [bacterium]